MDCNAKRRDGQPCKAPAMPNGRCRIHGGKAGRPPVVGRYSQHVRGRLTERAEAFAQEVTALDLLPELGMQRALLTDLLGKMPDGTPITATTRAEVMGIIDRIGVLAGRISDIRNASALTSAEVLLLLAVLDDVLSEKLEPDERVAVIDAIAARTVGRLAFAVAAQGTGADAPGQTAVR